MSSEVVKKNKDEDILSWVEHKLDHVIEMLEDKTITPPFRHFKMSITNTIIIHNT